MIYATGTWTRFSSSGVPVFALRGVKGGWQLDEGWRMRVPGLDEATLRADPGATRSIQAWRASEPVAGTQGAAADGWTTLRVHCEDEEQALFATLGLGSRVEVVAPTSRHERVVAEVAAMARRIDHPAPPPRHDRGAS